MATDPMAKTLETRERDDDDARLPRGRRLGRYVVLSEIGEGGMGVVYRAYDPELNRKVALKVLRGHFGDPSRVAVARVRLQREAQTLARLSHPNVVAVYDVGTRGRDVFLAMELVEGEDLRTWLASAERSPAQILAVLHRAGRGLAAAHAVGIVHRDFKPSNVLVAEDGRVCVTDFGLARPEQTCEPPRRSTTTEPDPRGDGSLFDLSLTEDGRPVGTPAYMAPEQHAGEPVDPRCDQYAFCVTMWEALYGQRPFLDPSPARLSEAKARGLPGAPPRRARGHRVPRAVRAALRRGLHSKPQRRFDRMSELLERMGPRPRGARTAAVAIVSALGAVSAWAAVGPPATDDTDPCPSAATRLEGVWDDAAREVVRRAFARTDAAWADTTAETVATMLDRHAEDWIAMHREACEATWVRGEQSPQLLDRRMACLTDRRRQIAATVAVLADADPGVVEHATGMVIALPRVSDCAGPAHLAAAPPSDPATAEQVAAVRDELASIAALRRAGRHREALEHGTDLYSRAEALPHPPTRAEIAIAHGRLLDDDGRPADAHEVLRDAAVIARGIGDTRAEARAWIELTRVVGGRLHQRDAGAFYGELALAAVAAAGDDLDLRAWAHLEIGEVAFRSGRDDEAAEHLRRSLTLREELYGPDHYLVAETLGRLAGTEHRAGDLEAARRDLERALGIYLEVFGAEHPRVAAPMGNLGLVLAAAGEPELALERMRRARAILEAAYGADHPGVATADDSIGHVLARADRPADAEPHFRAAIAGFDRTLGPEHPAVAAPLLGLGQTLIELRRSEDAIPILERARTVTGATELPAVQVADTDLALARALADTGDERRARALALGARERYVKVLAPEDDRWPQLDALLNAR